MTTLKKNTLALALVAAMGFAANASAYTLTTSGDADPELIATFDIAGNATVITTGEAFEIALDNSASESILGRTTGFNIVITLSNGAKFNATPTAVVGAANSTWVPSTIAGGAGQTFVTIKMDPAASPVGLVPGALVSFASEDLTNLAALQTAGQTVSFTVTFVDPVGGNNLYSPKSLTVIESGDPTDLTCDASGGSSIYSFYPNTRIDVGTGDPAGSYDSKTQFSYYGDINGADSYYFNAGTINVGIVSGFASFSYQATDTFETVLTGTSFAAFAGGNVEMYTNCGTDIVGTVSTDGTTVTFDYTGADLCSGTGGTWDVWFNADGSVIDATSITAKTTFTRGSFSSAGANCDLLPMQYNGSVVKVATFNPGGNTAQQSFLRVTNPSAIDGLVTIQGTDDAGNAGASDVTFTLAAGQSMQINSDVIENGGSAVTGALGDGTGKWRLVVTGEFAGMRVSSLNRNTTTGTVTNLTDYDTAQEQSSPTGYTGSDSY